MKVKLPPHYWSQTTIINYLREQLKISITEYESIKYTDLVDLLQYAREEYSIIKSETK